VDVPSRDPPLSAADRARSGPREPAGRQWLPARRFAERPGLRDARPGREPPDQRRIPGALRLAEPGAARFGVGDRVGRLRARPRPRVLLVPSRLASSERALGGSRGSPPERGLHAGRLAAPGHDRHVGQLLVLRAAGVRRVPGRDVRRRPRRVSGLSVLRAHAPHPECRPAREGPGEPDAASRAPRPRRRLPGQELRRLLHRVGQAVRHFHAVHARAGLRRHGGDSQLEPLLGEPASRAPSLRPALALWLKPPEWTAP
jgi:hypothetical protein